MAGTCLIAVVKKMKASPIWKTPRYRMISQLISVHDSFITAGIPTTAMMSWPIRMLSEYFINSILSGLATPAANVMGNTMFGGILTGERTLAGKLESSGFRQWLERNLAGTGVASLDSVREIRVLLDDVVEVVLLLPGVHGGLVLLLQLQPKKREMQIKRV